MDYEEFLKNYVPELQLIEALDKLNEFSEDAVQTINRLVSDAKDGKNTEESSPLDPSP